MMSRAWTNCVLNQTYSIRHRLIDVHFAISSCFGFYLETLWNLPDTIMIFPLLISDYYPQGTEVLQVEVEEITLSDRKSCWNKIPTKWRLALMPVWPDPPHDRALKSSLHSYLIAAWITWQVKDPSRPLSCMTPQPLSYVCWFSR